MRKLLHCACVLGLLQTHLGVGWLVLPNSSGPPNPNAIEKLEKYAAWHRKSATKVGTRVLIYRPGNGLGDQLLESLPITLHYCIVNKPRIRFEIAGPDGQEDVAIWRVGVSALIDYVHDANRSRHYNHSIIAQVDPANGGITHRHHDFRVIDPNHAVRYLLLHPTQSILDIVYRTLPPARPAVTIGVHVRTYVLEETQGTFDFGGSGVGWKFYNGLIKRVAKCVTSAATKEREQGIGESNIVVFLASDVSDVVSSLREVLAKKLPGVQVAFVPGQPKHSNRVVSPEASDENYENVWATWLSLLQAKYLCGGGSMFAESIARYSLVMEHQTSPTSCETIGWQTLLVFTTSVRQGMPANRDTMLDALQNSKMRSSSDGDESCYSAALDPHAADTDDENAGRKGKGRKTASDAGGQPTCEGKDDDSCQNVEKNTNSDDMVKLPATSQEKDSSSEQNSQVQAGEAAPNATPIRKGDGIFILLFYPSDALQLLHSLEACPWMYGKDSPTIFLMYELPAPPQVAQPLTQHDTALADNIELIHIHDLFHELPVGGVKGQRWRGRTDETEPHLSYRKMCNFFATKWWSLPQMQRLEYALRFDSNSELRCTPSTPSPFALMRERSARYGYWQFSFDIPEFSVGLPQLAMKFVKKHNLQPALDFDAEKSAKLTDWAPMFYNNFEVFHVATLTSPVVMKFNKAINKDGGIYGHRWGDAVIRFYQVWLAVRDHEMLCLASMNYTHGHCVANARGCSIAEDVDMIKICP